jgi:NADPH:quinone reductase-like Zn-dependent oxidoreductase
MRAVLMTATGGPEVLKLEDVPEPEISAEHDVLVRLRAAGINPVDYKLRTYGTFGRPGQACAGPACRGEPQVRNWNSRQPPPAQEPSRGRLAERSAGENRDSGADIQLGRIFDICLAALLAEFTA